MFVNKILYEFLQLHGECYFKFFLCFLICFCVSSRQTGALNRIIDRGSRAINYILTVMVFNVVPTILEVIINSLSVTVKLHMLCTSLSLCRLFLGIFLLHHTAFCFSLQIGMVSSILAYSFGSSFAWITSVSVATYTAFTLAVTQVQITITLTSQDHLANINTQFIISYDDVM
jgi:ABC-type transport system involved in Fe-S cluster assembly fused permease/ATPase subunit